MPLEYIEEVTYDEETGYFRVKQRSKSSHKFALADKLVSYADEVKGYLQPNRIKNLSGVHAKEFFFWVPIGDISVDEPPTGKIHFKSYTGLGDIPSSSICPKPVNKHFDQKAIQCKFSLSNIQEQLLKRSSMISSF